MGSISPSHASHNTASMAPTEPIEAQAMSDYSDADSGYDEKTLSTASVRSSIYDYEQENGRSYHAYKAGKYVLPNDEPEQERMNIHYAALYNAFGSLWFSPVDSPSAVLDVGTGTGAWALDVADSMPGAHVIGIDLSPIQPTFVPSNLEFQIADMEDPWDMDNRFDLIHTSNLHFNVKSWPNFYEQAYRSLRPGGWMESHEFDLEFTSSDGTLPSTGPTVRWCHLMNEGFTKIGTDGHLHPERMKSQMESIGFVNCQVIPIHMPIGAWPKDRRLSQAGRLFLIGILEGLHGLSVRMFTQVLGWSNEEMEILLADARNEMKQKRVHGYCPYYVVFGQKPEEKRSS